MTGVLVLALVAAGAGAILFGGQVKPPAEPDPAAAKPAPPRPPVPAPTGSAKAETPGPRPTKWEACLAFRATRELEAPSVIDKIAEMYVREVPREAALAMVGALGDAASQIPDPPSRTAALAGIAEALLDLDAKKEARVSLDLARDAAAKAGISARGGEGLTTLGRIAAGYVRVGEPDLAKELGGDSAEVVSAIALAHVRVGDLAKAKPLADTVRAALEASPQRLQTRIAMARLYAALGSAGEAREVADGSAESERALIHYRVAEVYVEQKSVKEALASLASVRDALDAAQSSWQRKGSLLVEVAKAYRTLGKLTEADAVVEEVLTLSKDQAKSMYQGPILAQVATDLAQAGDLDRAEEVIAPAADSELARTIAYPIARIEILARRGKLEDALALLEKDLSSWTSLAYGRIGASYAAAKTRDAAFAETLRKSACAF